MRVSGLVAVGLLTLLALGGLAQVSPYAPPAATPPDKDTLQEIDSRAEKLATALDSLRSLSVRDPGLAEVEIYFKAAAWVRRYGEFYNKNAGKTTLEVLDRGLLRASQLGRGETPWWNQPGRSVARAYRSRIDGSVQPYAVTLPHDYGTAKEKRYRIDVVLHGRAPTLTEVNFLHQHREEVKAAKEQTWVQLDIYGRGNNAYRWAGEVDVYEALENFLGVENILGRGQLLDPSKVVLRGFSMGGAGTWHLGLHRPDHWAVIGPGAGFTTTHGYVKDLPAKLPPYQEACLHIYDAVDYAENAFDVPIVAYAGEDDKQLQAAKNIQARLKPLGIPMTLLIAPKLGHSFPPEWQKKAEAEYETHLDKERDAYPHAVHFVTWTLKYPSCSWVEILGLQKHYERASVEAERDGERGFKVKTANVRQLHLNLWRGATRGEISVDIDGQKLESVRPYQTRANTLHVYLEKRDGKWATVLPELIFTDRTRRLQKVSGLQGPIDDAFMSGFLCVRGTGKPWSEEVQKHADATLERFEAEWSKYLRGDLQVKKDTDVTPEDIAGRHLILFGDPGSNSLISQILPNLPFQWTPKDLTWGGKTYPSASHLPVLVYPSPLSTNRYVVLNSGHTFGAKDFQDTNAMLFPRLGDFAVVKTTDKKDAPAEVIQAGLFDDFWRLEKP